MRLASLRPSLPGSSPASFDALLLAARARLASAFACAGPRGALIEELTASAGELGCRSVDVLTDDANTAAMSLYATTAGAR